MNSDTGIRVLDEGIEESIEALTTCCPSGPAKYTPPK